jgi:hypothetical protein
MNIMSKPLTWWAVGEGLKLLGWTPINETVGGKRIRVKKEIREQASLDWLTANSEQFYNTETAAEEWLKLLDKAYYAHDNSSDEAAERGKKLHAELEKYVKFSMSKGGAPVSVKSENIQPFIDWALENVEKFLWSEMHMYSEVYWLGGISDAGAIMKSSGNTAIIDFKSSKAAYASQFFQCGGYQVQIEENGGVDSTGNKILDKMKIDTHIIVPFGAEEFSPVVVNDEHGKNKEAFLAALTLMRAKQMYEPD